jgi:hypothetical protein
VARPPERRVHLLHGPHAEHGLRREQEEPDDVQGAQGVPVLGLLEGGDHGHDAGEGVGGGAEVKRRKLNLKAMFESAFHKLVSSAESRRAFNSDFDTGNLHRPTEEGGGGDGGVDAEQDVRREDQEEPREHNRAVALAGVVHAAVPQVVRPGNARHRAAGTTTCLGFLI